MYSAIDFPVCVVIVLLSFITLKCIQHHSWCQEALNGALVLKYCFGTRVEIQERSKKHCEAALLTSHIDRYGEAKPCYVWWAVREPKDIQFTII